MIDPDIAEAIANLPDATILGIMAEFKPHVDGLPYPVVAIWHTAYGPRKTVLQYFATAAESLRAAKLINQHTAAVIRLTSSDS